MSAKCQKPTLCASSCRLPSGLPLDLLHALQFWHPRQTALDPNFPSGTTERLPARLIEMHGGLIWMELQLGKGSTFFVMLPVQAQAQTKSPSK